MVRIFNLLVRRGFKIEKYVEDYLEAYHADKNLRVKIYKDQGTRYNTTWETKDEVYNITSYKQNFIFNELEKYEIFS